MKHLLMGLLIIGCSNVSTDNDVQSKIAIPTESYGILDSAKVKSYHVTVKPGIFETGFFDGTKAKMDTFHIGFYAVGIGKIKIETGKIIACDPIVMKDAKPFSQTFPIGQFPVQLAIAKTYNDERVAFSRILFSDNVVVKWEYALQAGQKQIPINDKTLYGYGVDAGMGLFIDEKANKVFTQVYKENEDMWDQVFIKEMDKNYRNTWNYMLYVFNGHNFAAFSTGYGDGSYGTYVGYDSKGNVCRLLTDFGLVEWWKK